MKSIPTVVYGCHKFVEISQNNFVYFFVKFLKKSLKFDLKRHEVKYCHLKYEIHREAVSVSSHMNVSKIMFSVDYLSSF